jgi:uncharacterized protein YqeY
MSKKTELEDAMRESLRSGDSERKNTLRLVLTAIKEAEVRDQAEMDDDGVLVILQKQVKSRRETIADAEKAGRPDLIKDAESEIAILEDYLPKQMSDEELEALVDEAIAQTGAASPADMGKVMGMLMSTVQGRADGGKISQTVKAKLQGG